jgi:hypothetical protein
VIDEGNEMVGATSVEAAAAEGDGKSAAEKAAALRGAMLSVYYDSLGRKWSSTGAPAVLLPNPVRPLSLADALTEIKDHHPDHLRDAVWRVVRSVAPPGPTGRGEARYPPALRAAVKGTELNLNVLDDRRFELRKDANLVGAALVAAANDTRGRASMRWLLLLSRSALNRETKRLLGKSARRLLGTVMWGQGARRLKRLKDDVGLDLYQYVGDFADAVAFDLSYEPEAPQDMLVYPAACVVEQDTTTMITTITATALVRCADFWTIVRSTDPQCWSLHSDVVTGTRYVNGPFDLRPAPPIRVGTGYDRSHARMLWEQVNVRWGSDGGSGTFQNVLSIDEFLVEEKKQKVTVNFSLARSIDSRILWDQRPGGIQIDQGFIKVRPISKKHWRVTSRKTLLFSNRMPNANRPGWLGIGQMLNYLAPAALSWWLESELYSASAKVYSTQHETQQALDEQRDNGASDDRPG